MGDLTGTVRLPCTRITPRRIARSPATSRRRSASRVRWPRRVSQMASRVLATGSGSWANSCGNLTYLLTWSNEQPDRYWVPLPYQETAPGFIQFVEDKRTVMAGDKSWSVITKNNGYGFKNPGDFSDLHGSDDGSPEPIGYEGPTNGLNGIKADAGPTQSDVKPYEEG